MKKIKFAAIYILFVGIIFFIFNGFPTDTAENTVENNVPQQTDTKEPVKPQKDSPQKTPVRSEMQGDYPFLSERSVTENELQKYSLEELMLMRNEVFAKHGYIFKDPILKKHFSSKKWYRGLYDDTKIVYDKLSDIEKQNHETIKRAEANKKSIKTANGRTIYDEPYIDLGLPSKTLWANCNLGANKPWEYGDYYAWAETKPNKAKFVWDNYTKQKEVKDKSIAGTNEDAAFTADKKSAMPSNEQKNELLNECKWEWTSLKGVAGMVATGKNGKSIFLPAGGSYFDSWDGTLQQKGETCFYWTADCVGGEYFSSRAFCLIMSDGYAIYTDRNGDFCDGKLIRPVYKR